MQANGKNQSSIHQSELFEKLRQCSPGLQPSDGSLWPKDDIQNIKKKMNGLFFK